MTSEALKEAVQLAGGQNAMARNLGVSQASIWRWINENMQSPAEYVLRIEELTGVSRHELRPDIYPVETDRGSRDTQ